MSTGVDNPETSIRQPTDGMGAYLVITTFFLLLTASLTILAIIDEPTFDVLMWEDAWGEWATFFAFLFAGLIGSKTLFARYRQWTGSGREFFQPSQCALLTLSAFCLLAAGEEISWGQRLLGLRPPELFQELNFQQELNFHNILHYLFSPRLIVLFICIVYGVLLPVATMILPGPRAAERPNLAVAFAPHPVLVFWFTVTGIVYWFRPVYMSTEAAELMLGLLLLSDVYLKTHAPDSRSKAVPRTRSIGIALILGLPLLLGGMVNPIIDPILYGPDQPRVEQATEELQLMANDLLENEWINPSVATDGDLYDSRIYYAVNQQWLYFDETGNYFNKRDIQIDQGEVTRLNYFLDPWNNAYWIRMQGTQPVMLYSFGPNRRLDTILADEVGVPSREQIIGDDIGVWLDPFKSSADDGARTGGSD